MRYGKSIYRGGFIIDSQICDYESSRKLGIACPFCSQAVFLRAGSLYSRGEKQIIVNPAFCHYHSDDPLSQDCELRSERKDGQEYIKSLEVQSRNQRLELYNKRLWDFIKEDRQVKDLKPTIKAFGAKWIEQASRLAKRDLGKRLDFYLEQSRKQWNYLLNDLPNRKPSKNEELIFSEDERLAEFKSLQSYDKHLHQVISEEVIEFLSTHTGGYAYEKLFTFSLVMTAANLWVQKTGARADGNCLAFAELVKTVEAVTLNGTIVTIILLTNWTKLFYSLDSEE